VRRSDSKYGSYAATEYRQVLAWKFAMWEGVCRVDAGVSHFQIILLQAEVTAMGRMGEKLGAHQPLTRR
jgi:hypothetical protein